MNEKCNVICLDRKVSGDSDEGCLRPKGHGDPHLARHSDGRYIVFQTDWECGCECCRGDTPDLWCEVYREVSPEEAEHLIQSTDEVKM